MNKEFTIDPQRALHFTPVVYLSEATSFNHALHHTALLVAAVAELGSGVLEEF